MTAQEFHVRLDRHLGAFTITSLEKAAHLGQDTLNSARRRGSIPSLDVILAITRTLGIDASDLLGDATPPELLPQTADPAVRRIALHLIMPSPLNPRRQMDVEELDGLAVSIAARGLLQNLVVRPVLDQPGLFWIVAGERRYRAMALLREKNLLPAELVTLGIPCRVTALDDGEATLVALLENMQRADVNPMDEADAIHRLHTSNPDRWSTRVIAERLGVTQRQVQMRLKLVSGLTTDAQAALRAGTIKLAHAKVLLTQPIEDQADLLEEAATISPSELLDNCRSSNRAFLVDYAIFDVAASGLEIVDLDGRDMFIDGDAAYKLQLAAVDARCAELAAGGCEFAVRANYFNSRDYHADGTGVVVHVDFDGELTIRTGLRLRDDTTSPAEESRDEQNLRWKAEQWYRDAHQAAGAAFIAAIGRALDYDHAVQLLLWDSLCHYEGRVLQGHNNPLPARKQLAEASRAGEQKQPRQIEAAFAHIAGLTYHETRAQLVAMVAQKLSRPIEGHGLHPILNILADATDTDVPNILRETAAQRRARIEERLRTPEGQTDIEDDLDSDDDEAEEEEDDEDEQAEAEAA